MKKDLQELKRELCPDERDKAQAQEMQGFDDFQRKKHELNILLQDIRTDVDRLNEMRKKLGDDGRDNLTIRLTSENNDRLRTATDMFSELKRIQEKDEKKKKKKFSEKDIADRRELVALVGKEIMNLTNENARNKSGESEEETAMRERVDARKREQEEKTKARRARAKDRKKKKGQDAEDEDFTDVGPKSEQEVAFEQKVQENMNEQNQILDVISRGLDDLKELANEANKQLTVQGAMLQQVDEQMDKTILGFKAANKRLKDILEESGGMSRWCPMIICAIFLLALVGYIFGIV
jgi:hypothetical protein